MSATASEARQYTIAEYLAVEARTGERHAYLNGTITPMPGGTIAHNLISRNILVALENALDADSGFLVFGSEQKIYLPKYNFFLYPDAVAVSLPPEMSEQDTHAIINPVLIVEVLSPSTERYDRGQKFIEFQSLPSFREYCLIRQDQPEVLTFLRTDERTWQSDEITGFESGVAFQSIGVTINMKRIYKDVGF